MASRSLSGGDLRSVGHPTSPTGSKRELSQSLITPESKKSPIAEAIVAPHILMLALATIAVLAGGLTHTVLLRSATGDAIVNVSHAVSERLQFVGFESDAARWRQQVIASRGTRPSDARIGVRGLIGDENPALQLGTVSLSLGEDFVLRYAAREAIVVQHIENTPMLSAVDAFAALERATGGESMSGTGLVAAQVESSGETPFVVVFVMKHYTQHHGHNGDSHAACKNGVPNAIKVAHVRWWIPTLVVMCLAGAAFCAAALHGGARSVSSRCERMRELAQAADSMDLAQLSLLRIADGSHRRNLGAALQPRQLRLYDDLAAAVVQRLSEIRKHLPQIVLATRGTLAELLTIQAVDQVDAKELEFGGRSSPTSDTASLSSPGGGGGGKASSTLELLGGAMAVSYDIPQPQQSQSGGGGSRAGSPDSSPSSMRNPLLPRALNGLFTASMQQSTLLDMVGPSDYRCYMLLKKATFVVCRIFLPDAVEEDLAALHAITQSFFTTVSSIAAQFDGLIHSHRPTEIILTWNAFKPYPFHETRGGLCALHIASNMPPLEEDPALAGAPMSWCLVVNTGVVVVSQSGSANKLTPSIVGDSVTVAQRVAQLGPLIRSSVIVMEPAHVVARNQLFSIPVDVVGDETWRITLFDMKGKQEEHRATDRAAYVEGFSLFTRHRFAEAETKLFAAAFAEPQARRLLSMCRLFNSLQNVTALVPNPYHRQVPGWDFKELATEGLDIRGALANSYADESGSDDGMLSAVMLLSPSNTALSVKPRSRRPSILPQDFLRKEINRAVRSRAGVPEHSVVSRDGSTDGFDDGDGEYYNNDGGTDFDDVPDITVSTSANSLQPPTHRSIISKALRTIDSLASDSSASNSDGNSRPASAAAPATSRETTAASQTAPPSQRTSANTSTTTVPQAAPPMLNPVLVSMADPSLERTDTDIVFHPSPRSLRSPNVSITVGDGGSNDSNSWTDRKGHQWRLSGKKLGEGSFGAVYLGLSETGELVAVKQLPLPDGSSDAHAREIDNVLTEVATLSALRHENVVRYYSSAVVSSRLMIVMEYVSGGSLAQLLNHFGALPPMSVRRYAKDILNGLKFLHSKGIVHRDINPNNTLLTVDGACKLTDFGASKSLARLAIESDICGTPPYMSSESARGASSTASDIWSFGVMLAHMYLGRLPWRLEELQDVHGFLRRIATDPTFGPEVPGPNVINATERDFVMSCLAPREEDRLTAEQLLSHHFFML